MFWKRRSREADLERELQSHLELEAEEQRENGLSAEEARYAARRAFGSSARVAEQVREAWGTAWIDGLLQDFRLAVRVLLRNRGFATGAVVPLACAIGCAACALTFADAILFRPLGIKDPDRVAAVYSVSRQRNAFLSGSYPDFRDIRSLDGIVESAAAFVRIPVNVRWAEGTQRINSELVTDGYFRTTGVAPAVGRALGPDDFRPGAPPVALASYALWETKYRKNMSILGSVAWIDGVAFTIIGVMPRGYAGSLMDWYPNPSFWVPLGQIRAMLARFRNLDFENLRNMQWLMILARLRPGASLTQLQAAVDTLARRVPERGDVGFVALGANQARFFPGHRTGTIRILWIFAAVSVAALAIACFNLANLLFARAAARQKEIGARLALGVGRLRLLRQFAVENLVLSVCACLLGLPISFALARSAPVFQRAFGLSLDLTPDAPALAASALAGVMTALAAGGALAWRSYRISPMTAMKEGTFRHPGLRALVTSRDLLVAAQVACAMTTLATTMLLSASLRQWSAVPLGYDPHGILAGNVDTLSAKLPDGGAAITYRALLAEVRSQSRGAALAAESLPSAFHARIDVLADAISGRWTSIEFDDVSDGYFELLGMPVTRGRGFLAGDDGSSRPVVALNQTAAALLWPDQNPIGRQLRIRGETRDREVVGVVANARYRPLGEEESPAPFAFLPLFQHVPPAAVIHALAPGEPGAFGPRLRQIVRGVAPDMPLSNIEPLDARVESGLSQMRLVSQAIGAVCTAAMALALAGVFASAAYRVAQRKREIAIRIAIGAGPGRVVRSFAARGIAIGMAGSFAGLVPAAWAAALLRSWLRGVGSPALLTFGAAGLALALMAGAASWAAARRISRAQPAELLRVQ